MPFMQYPKLELKYCERCGGLWLRPQGGEAVYCSTCAVVMRDIAPPKARGGTPASSADVAWDVPPPALQAATCREGALA